VTVHPLPVITVDTPVTVCLNTPVQLTAGGAATYAWSPAAGLSCVNCATPVATPAATTTYTVTGTDNNGCSSMAQTTISILSLPAVNAGADISTCKLDSVKLNASGAVSYVWTPAAGLSCTTCSSPTASPAASTAYVVTGTGANGCTANDTVNVNLHAQPPVNAGPDQTICSGQSAQLQASGATTYAWTPAAHLSCVTCANPLSTPDSTITYMVSGTDMNGCQDSDLVTITVIQRGPVTIDTGGSFCIGGSLRLKATGGDVYTWTPATGLSCTDCETPVASPTETTTYTVVIRQGTCFADTLNATVVVHPLPTIDAGPDQSIILGNSAQIKTTGTNIAEYSWSPADALSCRDCASPVASPPVNTTYVVTVTSEFGCTASDDVRVIVRCDGTQVWMPNTFTPNADGQNDFFYPHGKGLSQVTRFRIYDRWGELIYDRMNMPVNDRNNGWDGTYKNQALKPDVYVWILNATCTNGEPLELKGDISLIR
jgi:gliding motility-associated-like protein